MYVSSRPSPPTPPRYCIILSPRLHALLDVNETPALPAQETWNQIPMRSSPTTGFAFVLALLDEAPRSSFGWPTAGQCLIYIVALLFCYIKLSLFMLWLSVLCIWIPYPCLLGLLVLLCLIVCVVMVASLLRCLISLFMSCLRIMLCLIVCFAYETCGCDPCLRTCVPSCVFYLRCVCVFDMPSWELLWM